MKKMHEQRGAGMLSHCVYFLCVASFTCGIADVDSYQEFCPVSIYNLLAVMCSL